MMFLIFAGLAAGAYWGIKSRRKTLYIGKR